MCVDAPALVSIIANERDATVLADALERHDEKLCSALLLWETIAALCRSYRLAPSAADALVSRYVEVGSFLLVAIGRRELELATSAYTRFGKGRHPAGLNMGDCYAYACACACAKANNSRLLYKGEYFTKTDLA